VWRWWRSGKERQGERCGGGGGIGWRGGDTRIDERWGEVWRIEEK